MAYTLNGFLASEATATQTLSTLQRTSLAPRDVHLALAVLGARKVDKHLFERRLADGVVVDVVVLLGALHRAEDARPRQLLAGHLSDISTVI